MASIDLSQDKLVFDDEFTSLSLNSASNPKGTWDTTFAWGGRTLSSNGEQEFYIDPSYNNLGVNPFSIQNGGGLTISAQPASAAVKAADGGLPYTSGLLTTHDTFSQTYGYFEMKAELPAGKGLWPAFWLLNTDGKWPPEIDIVEMLGNQTTTDYTTLHTGTGNQAIGKANTVADTTTGYHTYGVDWEPNTTTFYFDGQAVFSAPTPGDMHSPMYMLANLAVGGSWPGSPDGSTHFPADMNIAYIKAYASPNTIANVNDSAAAVNGTAPVASSTTTAPSSGTTTTAPDAGHTTTTTDAGHTASVGTMWPPAPSSTSPAPVATPSGPVVQAPTDVQHLVQHLFDLAQSHQVSSASGQAMVAEANQAQHTTDHWA